MWKVYALAALGITMALGVVGLRLYSWGHGDGVLQERGLAEAALAELNDRLELVNRDASKRESLRLTQMAELEQHIEELRSVIDADPDADRPAFGPDSVQRLNSVQ